MQRGLVRMSSSRLRLACATRRSRAMPGRHDHASRACKASREGREISGETRRLFPVEAMSGTMVDG